MTRPLMRMFGAVPRRYDLMNRLLTLGLDQVWRREALDEALAIRPERIMDICTGTGDMAIMAARHAPVDTRVVAVDFVQGMLERAGAKARRAGLGRRIRRVRSDAAALPFGDGSFDAVTIAFGFRNLTFANSGRDLYLAEILRVLRPGGRFVIVETSQPDLRLWRASTHAYMRAVVGPVGGLLSGQRGAYRYLAHSAIHYYTADELCALLEAAGFVDVVHRPLLGGVAALTRGSLPHPPTIRYHGRSGHK